MTDTYAVIGATGATGGAVVAALVERGLRVRAVARNPQSPRAQKLSQAGIEIAAADLGDEQALTKAFTGVAGVFAVTTPFEEGPDIEVQQGLHIIGAAAQARVAHLVLSSVSDADQQTGIPHFESKARIEEALAASGVPHTIVGPTYFYDNLLGGIDELQSGRFALPLPATTPLQQLSRRDLGRFVATILLDPQRFTGLRIDVASDAPTPQQMTAALEHTLGYPIELITYDPSQIASADMRAMFSFLSVQGYSAHIADLHQRYPEIGWQTFGDWVDEHLVADRSRP
ncbi:NmrA/HSCARG family protein [Mycobacterium sp. CBMA293]|uniref:NmrA/HSCARG family protein n=1 Tax=unclassified Mycolicibacterium TaxID=2636767 RepID=UPI0012DBD997|nr:MULTISPECIES: NmrA/HSCARG family protein [unclassified Mycolicibacterium]MUL45248.1 NmrA/HSCARG family protein [Mycolicibacterium sp. CBMA 360]MUL56767.1 NmrA/HSCARG family protein [Mycolicibacterium sp. CBMA 335]MUL69806.1 NmrA/HSCARG family protein [Mycolicibacterium sp. CBMA 311]MUL91854.1 NmrA/HSCARG family protein [Mycolicibacterium sp. CBMA 230]MUM05593.1 NmrA family transcriptional regulator [Mycolicibacterium sp. CBMA 213]